MKRESRLHFMKGVDSLVLSIEHYDRPWDRGRSECRSYLPERWANSSREVASDLCYNGFLATAFAGAAS